APLRTRPLDHARGLCYRGPWRLPGPDSHRLAALSLSIGYVITTSTSLLSWRPIFWTHPHFAGTGAWPGPCTQPKMGPAFQHCSGGGATAPVPARGGGNDESEPDVTCRCWASADFRSSA